MFLIQTNATWWYWNHGKKKIRGIERSKRKDKKLFGALCSTPSNFHSETCRPLLLNCRSSSSSSSSHHLTSQTGSLLSEPPSGRKKIISNTKLSVYTRKMRGKIWLPELGGAQTRVLLCAKETKALPLWPWIDTKHGAELLNGGAIASDTCSCHSITVISSYDSHLVGSQGFWRKRDGLLEMQWNDKIWGNTLKEDHALNN